MRPPPTTVDGPAHGVPPSAPQAPGRPTAAGDPDATDETGGTADTGGTGDTNETGDTGGAGGSGEPPEDPGGTDGRTPVPDRRHRRAWHVGTVAVLVVLVAVAGGWGLHLRAQHADATRSLERTRATIHRAVGQLLTAEVDLSTTQSQRATVTATLAHETSLLTSAEAQLASDRSTISTQGVDIADLTACLTGVQQALNAVSLDDVSDALVALGSVGSACQDVEP